MVGGKKTKPREKTLMGSHQRCWLWGRNVVLETLRAGVWPPHEVRYSEVLDESHLSELRSLCGSRDIALHATTDRELRDTTRAEDHQGMAARMPPFPYWSSEKLLATLPPNAALVVLDGIQDPFNFGAILRSAEVLGLDGVIVASARQAEVTAQVVRSSAGAINHVPLTRVDSLPAFVALLKQGGTTVWGASEKGRQAPWDVSLTGATAIVIGNEGVGVSAELLEQCDELVAIPQRGRINSLNAAVAAGILFYEVTRRRADRP